MPRALFAARPCARMTKPFRPHISPDDSPAELSFKAVFLGLVLGSLFAAANAYVGLKVGLTVSASIPVAVVSMAVFRAMRTGTILENNMSQTVGSAGESLAAGIIFTLPALYLWGHAPSFTDVLLTTVLGGTLGVLFMIPLRKFLIVQEHENLPYPEGTACAEVLKAGESGGDAATKVFLGLGIGVLYAAGFKVLGFIKSSLHAPFVIGSGFRTALSIDAYPSLAGVGYILGIRVASMMLAGAAVGWLVIIPLLGYSGDHLSGILPPASTPLSELDPDALWDKYIRFIGAGAVTFGGLISLFKTLWRFAVSLKAGVARKAQSSSDTTTVSKPLTPRTDTDLPWKASIGIGLVCAGGLWATGIVESGWAAAAVVLFSGIFVAVSSQIVGLVGGSSNPVSGMTITSLLGTALILSAHGAAGMAGMVQTITVGAVVCIAACMAGDTSQDLKTGYLLGATPRRQQIGELIGTVMTAIVLAAIIPFILTLPGESGSVLNLVGADPGVAAAANPEFLAPQANVMKTLVEGVFQGNLPWGLLMMGMALALVVELLGAPSLPFAVGLYLPFGLSAGVFAGGFLRWLADKFFGSRNAEQGVLMASGLIAGEALTGLAWIGALWFSSYGANAWGWSALKNEPLFDAPASIDLYTLLAYGLVLLLLFRTGRASRNS
jgi:putative OPT family oligopeptide transporter